MLYDVLVRANLCNVDDSLSLNSKKLGDLISETKLCLQSIASRKEGGGSGDAYSSDSGIGHSC